VIIVVVPLPTPFPAPLLQIHRDRTMNPRFPHP